VKPTIAHSYYSVHICQFPIISKWFNLNSDAISLLNCKISSVHHIALITSPPPLACCWCDIHWKEPLFAGRYVSTRLWKR